MRHPFRRYCFFLGEKLGKSLEEIQALSSAEITEWMAYDLTSNEKWITNYEQEKELEKQRAMSGEQKAQLFKKLLGGK